MGSVSDFLFGNSPPATTTTYGSSSTSIPQWLQDYSKGIIAKANTLAAQPAPVYPGPQVAGPSADQSASYASLNALNSNPTASQAASPYMQAGSAFTNQALQPGQFGSAAAQPYMNKASAQFNDPNTVNSYMSPYINNVIQRNQTLSNQNFADNVMPGLTSQFIGNGQQAGGSPFGNALGVQLKQKEEALNSQNLADLNQGYNTAGQLFGQDASRMGTLGQLAGTLATEGQGALLQGGAQQGALGALAGQLQNTSTQTGIGAAQALGTAGTQEQQNSQQNLNAAYNNWLTQTQYPYQMTNWMAGLAGQVPYGTTNSMSAQTPYGSGTPSPFTQATQGAGGLGQIGSILGGIFGNNNGYNIPDASGAVQQDTNPSWDVLPDYTSSDSVNQSQQPFRRGGFARMRHMHA